MRIKRLFDLIISAPLLLLLSPILIAIAAAIRITMGKNIIFKQIRPGLHGRPFTLFKFRTMICGSSSESECENDAERLTKLGKILRSTSLDELPELFNVLIGDMSLVGPRPLLMEYLDLYTRQQAKRHNVKPGITGWAQVNGRNSLDWEERFKLDVWYVKHRSIWLDIKIIVKTFFTVLKQKGISQDGEATMTKFQRTSQRND